MRLKTIVKNQTLIQNMDFLPQECFTIENKQYWSQHPFVPAIAREDKGYAEYSGCSYFPTIVHPPSESNWKVIQQDTDTEDDNAPIFRDVTTATKLNMKSIRHHTAFSSEETASFESVTDLDDLARTIQLADPDVLTQYEKESGYKIVFENVFQQVVLEQELKTQPPKPSAKQTYDPTTFFNFIKKRDPLFPKPSDPTDGTIVIPENRVDLANPDNWCPELERKLNHAHQLNSLKMVMSQLQELIVENVSKLSEIQSALEAHVDKIKSQPTYGLILKQYQTSPVDELNDFQTMLNEMEQQSAILQEWKWVIQDIETGYRRFKTTGLLQQTDQDKHDSLLTFPHLLVPRRKSFFVNTYK